MIKTNDKLLIECWPKNITWNVFTKDCELAVNVPGVHSDEWSTDNDELAKEEIENKKRPERLADSNSVIIVHEKNWRSSRVCKRVKLFFIISYLYIITYIF